MQVSYGMLGLFDSHLHVIFFSSCDLHCSHILPSGGNMYYSWTALLTLQYSVSVGKKIVVYDTVLREKESYKGPTVGTLDVKCPN